MSKSNTLWVCSLLIFTYLLKGSVWKRRKVEETIHWGKFSPLPNVPKNKICIHEVHLYSVIQDHFRFEFWVHDSDFNLFFLMWLCRHPFDSSKWRHICQFLMTEGILDKNQIVEPLEASQEDLLVVSTTFTSGPSFITLIFNWFLQYLSDDCHLTLVPLKL